MPTKYFTGICQISGFVILIQLVLNANLRADPPRYTVTVIDTSGESTAAGINNHGQVAGNAGGVGFLHTPGVGVTSIGALGSGGSTVVGLNDQGQVVGKSESVFLGGVSYSHAFVYTPGVGMVDIQGPGFYRSEANDINNDGLVTVYNNDQGLPGRPGTGVGLLYNAATQALTNVNIALEINETEAVFPYAINDLSAPVGRVDGRAAIMVAYVDPLTNNVISYHDLGGSVSFALDINDHGLAVGKSRVGGLDTAVVFNGGGSLGVIGGLDGSLQSWASSINNAGQIVGNSQSASNTNIFHSFVRIEGVNHDMNNLIDPGLGITDIRLETLFGRPDAINEWGQIAAYGSVAGLGTRALILNPVVPVTSGVNLSMPGKAVRNTKFIDGMNFDTFTPTTNPLPGSLGTTVELLDGTAGANRDVYVGFDATGAFGGLASDIVTVSGTADDTFALQISYDEGLANTIFGSEENAFLSWRDPVDSIWKNAVLGNTSGVPVRVSGPYDPLLHFVLGYYGVDTTSNTVWAVLNHNSDFAAGGENVPEPSTTFMLALAVLLFSSRRDLLDSNRSSHRGRE